MVERYIRPAWRSPCRVPSGVMVHVPPEHLGRRPCFASPRTARTVGAFGDTAACVPGPPDPRQQRSDSTGRLALGATSHRRARWDGADRIRTGVLPHAVKARPPLRYAPHPAGDHTRRLHTAAREYRRRATTDHMRPSQQLSENRLSPSPACPRHPRAKSFRHDVHRLRRHTRQPTRHPLPGPHTTRPAIAARRRARRTRRASSWALSQSARRPATCCSAAASSCPIVRSRWTGAVVGRARGESPGAVVPGAGHGAAAARHAGGRASWLRTRSPAGCSTSSPSGCLGSPEPPRRCDHRLRLPHQGDSSI